MPQYLSAVELHNLDGEDGFQINGAFEDDGSGRSVSLAGDVNGDGFEDLIIGAPSPYANTYTGAFVVFGTAAGFDPVFALSDLDGTNGFWIKETLGTPGAGWSVSNAGDINGDGIDDVIVGTHKYAEFGHASYVVFGTTSGFDATLPVSDLDGNNGFRIEPADFDNQSGAAVSGAGDVNGDGFDDVIVGTYRFDPDGAYVVFGKAGGFGATFDLSNIDGNNGFQIVGGGNGRSVTSADVNGDGFSDVVAGRWLGADPNGAASGTSYVIFGHASPFAASLDVATLDGNNGFRINGEAAGDYSSTSVSSGGDINADGYEDIIVGAPGADPNGDRSGAAYVVFGSASGFASEINLSSLDGNNGFQINGAAPEDAFGGAVSSAGDVNGDGFDDITVGATAADPHGDIGAGTSYVIFGKASGFGAVFEVSSLDGNNGFVIRGDGPSAYSGISISAADINSDGFADVIVGTLRGASYVVYGSMPLEPVTRIGSAIGNIIHGSDFNDTLNGQNGDDTLIGYAGKDDLRGGGDGDTLDGGAGKDRLVGGVGADTLDGGKQADKFVYTSASHSTGGSHDTAVKFDFTEDVFDMPGAVAAIDATITTGMLRSGQFDADVAAAADAGHLGANHAVIFTPDSGNQAGKTFLVVDANGTAGYQAGEDVVIRLANAVNIASLGIEDFI